MNFDHGTGRRAAKISLESAGACIVLGTGEQAIAAGERLAERLDAVTVLLADPADDLTVPLRGRATLRRGAVRAARGHLGAFVLVIDRYGEAVEAPRGALRFETPEDGVEAHCDILVDLTGGAPLFGAHGRDGYLRPDPGDPLAVERALFDATGLVGVFDKPRYVALREHLCAHGRNGTVGCTRCLDVCPVGAIAPAGDHIAIDPYVCAGCGACHAACPTGAVRYADPPADHLQDRIVGTLGEAVAAGERRPVLLLHDTGEGADMLALLDRDGDGLPAFVRAVALNHATLAGPELLFHALAAGASRVVLLLSPGDDAAPLARHLRLVDGVMAALGHGEGRVVLADERDPLALGEALARLERPRAPEPGRFAAAGDLRERLRGVFAHLRRHAPEPAERVALEAGAPFGAVHVADGCTLCLACVSVCPTAALGDDADRPRLSFREDACVQCGLCVATCPERVMALEPRLDLTEAAAERRTLREEEPFACIVCGKPFAVRSQIERVLARLVGHPMMSDPRMSDRMQMCGDCRVADLAGAGQPRVDRPRTTDDWLARAGVDGKRRG